jgi:hypothetical protein
VRLDKKQKENLAKILTNVGTAGFVGLVVGRFVSPEKVATADMLWGVVFSIICFITVLLIDREEK